MTLSIQRILQKQLSVAFKSLAAALLAISLFSAPAVLAAKSTDKAVAQVPAKVSLNKANAELLAEVLNGVGIKKAEAIVAWRKANGKFKTLDQLAEVKGIGSATIEKNRSKLTL